jgi:hypothetical protein
MIKIKKLYIYTYCTFQFCTTIAGYWIEKTIFLASHAHFDLLAAVGIIIYQGGFIS